MTDDYIGNMSLALLKDNLIGYENFIEKYQSYNETSHNSAINFLVSNLNKEEINSLTEIIYGLQGWYCSKMGKGTIKLKATAAVLQLTHDFFHFEKEKFLKTIEVIEGIETSEIEILISVYLKQKLLTYKNLKNNSREKITLYRGLKIMKSSSTYRSMNLESWTSRRNVAEKFATSDGFILEKDFNIKQIFAYNKSVFKNPIQKNNKASRFINMEYEYIVEHNDEDSKIPFELGHNLFKN